MTRKSSERKQRGQLKGLKRTPGLPSGSPERIAKAIRPRHLPKPRFRIEKRKGKPGRA
jgi:hypothetical protein